MHWNQTLHVPYIQENFCQKYATNKTLKIRRCAQVEIKTQLYFLKKQGTSLSDNMRFLLDLVLKTVGGERRSWYKYPSRMCLATKYIRLQKQLFLRLKVLNRYVKQNIGRMAGLIWEQPRQDLVEQVSMLRHLEKATTCTVV